MQVNISYYLDEHGWSSCWIYADGKLHEILISHVYLEDPIEECINALIGVMNGDVERKFNWYGEPGGDQVVLREIPKAKHKVEFEVIGFSEEHGDGVRGLKVNKGKAEIEFEIKKIQLIRMFYFEFKKIFELLKDTQFAENRKTNFPFKRFREFELIALKYIGLSSK